MTSLRERHKAQNTLVCLLQALKGKVTTIELRNESSVKGRIDSVDGIMNVQMSNTVFTNPLGLETAFSDFYVQGKNIRFVQIPDEVNIIGAMQHQIRIIEGVRTRQERKPRTNLTKRSNNQSTSKEQTVVTGISEDKGESAMDKQN